MAQPRTDDGAAASKSALLARLSAQIRGVLVAQGEREKIQRDAVLAFSVRVLSAGLLYLAQIVLARWMGSYDYGIYVFVWTWVLILGGLSQLGLNLVSIRMIPRYRTQGDDDHLRGLLFGVRMTALGCGSLVAAIGLLGVWLFQSHLESPFILPLYLGLVCVPLYALTDVQDGIGRGNAWMSVALVPPYVLRPLILLASMAAAQFIGFQMNAATAAGAAILATWAAAVIQAGFINKKAARIVASGPRRYSFSAWLKMSMPLLVILGCELLLQNTDILVISHYMSPSDVGIYFAAGKTMALIMFVHYAVGSAVAHKFSALHARGDHDGLRVAARDAVNWTFWPSLAGAIVILALGQPLLWLFGPQFADGYPVMAILVVGFLARSAMGPAEYLLNMLGEQSLCAAVLALSAAANIGLNVVLVPKWGLTGGAIATSLSLMLVAALNAIAVSRRLGIQIAIWHNLPKF